MELHASCEKKMPSQRLKNPGRDFGQEGLCKREGGNELLLLSRVLVNVV